MLLFVSDNIPGLFEPYHLPDISAILEVNMVDPEDDAGVMFVAETVIAA
tara:strand:- start:8 stop:154 length:147 start_codon:yes stop_codon:yes gene_type:complete